MKARMLQPDHFCSDHQPRRSLSAISLRIPVESITSAILWYKNGEHLPKNPRPIPIHCLRPSSSIQEEVGGTAQASNEWTGRLISRLTKQPLGQHNQGYIFTPLGMTSSTNYPQDHPDIFKRLLKMVRREGDRILPCAYQVKELVCSVPDLATLLTDLISTSSKLLNKESIDFLFAPQFEPSSAALSYIRRDTENYAAPAGIPASLKEAPVNHSLTALVVEEELPLSHMPAGTVTWNGMPNLIWAMHKKKGLGVIFATQLLPVDDEKTVDLAMTFMREVWATFG